MAGKFFKSLRNILKAIINLDVDQIALEIARTTEHKKLVISLNTEGLPTSQLFELGEDSEGLKLDDIGGGYTLFTIYEKLKFDQPVDRVTLKDTGAFYRTFDVRPFNGGFTIEADTFKDGDNLENRWGKDIVGLNDDNLNILIEFYKERILEKVRSNIRKS
tara:strand:+ start:10217 stop:10699 length:483 start_codon:yes stop_codon:yes gene_type:complete